MSLTPTQTIRTGLGVDGAQVSGHLADTGTTLLEIDHTYPDSTSDVVLAIAFTAANVKQIFLLASKDLTIKTNSTGGADTISLKAGIAFSWSASAAYFANPFGTNVTSFHITATLASHLQGFVLTDT